MCEVKRLVEKLLSHHLKDDISNVEFFFFRVKNFHTFVPKFIMYTHLNNIVQRTEKKRFITFCRDRTCDQQLRRLLLFPTELRMFSLIRKNDKWILPNPLLILQTVSLFTYHKWIVKRSGESFARIHFPFHLIDFSLFFYRKISFFLFFGVAKLTQNFN